MTQDDFKFWTGVTTNYTSEQWAKIQANAAKRLASFLCLESLPDPLPTDLEEVLANFIASVLTFQGTEGEVASKHVRNFTINFHKSVAANAFAKIAQQYGDVLEEYSECGLGVHVSGKAWRCCQ